MIPSFGAIESLEFLKAPNYKTVIALKTNGGKFYIDARKWFKWGSQDDFHASKIGLMLEIDDWKAILPMIQSFIDENQDSKSANIEGK